MDKIKPCKSCDEIRPLIGKTCARCNTLKTKPKILKPDDSTDYFIRPYERK